MLPSEVRALRGVVEVRAGGDRRIGGYAAKFNKLSRNLGGFVERVDPGFFAKSEGDAWPGVMARWNHEDAYLLGTSDARTLSLVVDGTGLDYAVDLPAARGDLFELVGRGDVKASSFAFRVAPGGDDWNLTEDGFPLRTLLSGQLVDVAPVNDPAYLDTSTGLRSLAAKFDADPAEVRSMAECGELARLFRRSDPAPTITPAVGAAESTPLLVVPRLRQSLDLRK